MATADPIDAALRLPSGASFHRCALQVNPHGYEERFRGKPNTLSVHEHARALTAAAFDLGITVLGITDHNCVGGVRPIRDEATLRGIVVFPGFEVASSEGVHVLCLYPPATDEERLGRYLGELGIRDPGPSATASTKTLTDLLRFVQEQGGITIAAHATNDNGLLKVLDGQARIRAWQDRSLLAIQIPGSVLDLPLDVRPIVEGKNPDYRRSRLAADGLAMAVVNASDVVTADDLAKPSASCWIKMTDVSIDGLRQAFLDPASRVRLSSDPIPEEHAELVALCWEGGFLDGAAVHFNANLNVLVGGRGTGKSTIVESLRTVLGLDCLGDEARKAHEGIVRYVLKNGTKVSLLVRSYRPARKDFRIERTIPNPPIVRDDTGQVSSLLPRDVLPRVEVFGQHEIAELGRSREKLTRLLDRFVERDDSLRRRKSDLRRDLEKTRRAIVDVRHELAQIQERLASLPGLEETLKRFQDAGLEERLREQSIILREERVLNTATARVAPLREHLGQLRGDLPIDRAFLSEGALGDLPGAPILRAAEPILGTLTALLERKVSEIEEALRAADVDLEGVRDRWLERKRVAQLNYEKILRELQKSRVDGEEFIRLRRQIEDLRPLKERESLLVRSDKEHSERRRTLLATWEDLKGEEFRLLDRAAQRVTKKLRDRVKVEVTAGGDREPLAKVLRDEIGGRLSETIEALSRVADFSLTRFVDACRGGAAAVQKAYSLGPAAAERLAKATPDVLMRIEELELSPTTRITLNTALAGEPPAWRALEDLSTGQKATAVLLLLLLESDAPLVVDQPEDDLDNRFIAEGVVPRMRDEKRRRQFVFSTHNANIPVLGDAELILGLTASGEADRGSAHVPPEFMGSIDSKLVRELVEEVLEGGKDAFETRRLKYGF